MKIYSKISGLLLLTILTVNLAAQEAGCNIRKKYPVVNGTSLKLSNKYGDVNIITSESDSLSICATITIEQDDKEIANKSLTLINIDFRNIRDTIIVETSFEKKFFSTAYRQGRRSFSVDYTIELPTDVNVDVTNIFGDISVEELTGIVKLRLSQGTLNAKKLTRGNIQPLNSINIDHGNIDADNINWIRMTLRNCQSVSIEKGQALAINSDFSKIRLGEISSLVSSSKSDNYKIRSVKNMASESSYSGYEIDNLYGRLSSKLTYGSMLVSIPGKEFRNIDILSNSAPVTIVGQNSSFRADLTVKNASADFSAEQYPDLIKVKSNNVTSVAGIAGRDKETKSQIKIVSDHGDVTLK
jgi:hypothetical protein